MENRARLLLKVTEAVVGVWGADRVGVRLSPGSTFNDMSDANLEETFTYVAEALNPFGLAYLHVVESAVEDGVEWRNGEPVGATAMLGAVFQGPMMSNGGYNRETAEAAVASGLADLISFGQLFIANPDLVDRFILNAPLNEPDASTFYGGGAEGYIDYPTIDTVAPRTRTVGE